MFFKGFVVSCALFCVGAAPPGHGQATSYTSFSQHQEGLQGLQHSAPLALSSGLGGYRSGGLHAAPISHSAPIAIHSAPILRAAPVAVHSVPIHTQAVHHEEDHYDAHPQYAFKYGVEDHHTGDIKSQQETRDGDVVKGEYSVHQPDGTILRVVYTVDKHSGFNAVVHREGHGNHPVHQPKAVIASPHHY